MRPWSRQVRRLLAASHRLAERRGGLARLKLREVAPARAAAWATATVESLLLLGPPGARAEPSAGETRHGIPSAPLPTHVRFALLQLRARAKVLRKRSSPSLQAWRHVLGLAQHYGGKGIARALRLPPPLLPPWLASPEAIRRWTDRLAPGGRAERARWLIEGRRAFLLGARLLSILATAATPRLREAA